MPDIWLDTGSGGSGRLAGYLARPSGSGPWPGVVAIHEALGLNDIVRRQADRLAAAGYLTLAPDLFTDGGAARCLVATFQAMFSGHGKAVEDIAAAREHLRSDPGCTGKVGAIGFCMGGGFALITASHGWDVAAANYGVVPMKAERALKGACPIVASYGARDVSMRGMAKKLERTLTTLDIEHDVKEYPSAGHSFLNDREVGPQPIARIQRVLNLGPHPEAAQDAWQRIEQFFAKHLT